MALDVLIRHHPAMRYATVGRSFYTPVGCQALSGPLDVWPGFYQSARPTLGMLSYLLSCASVYVIVSLSLSSGFTF